jgi:hypothetical protein
LEDTGIAARKVPIFLWLKDQLVAGFLIPYELSGSAHLVSCFMAGEVFFGGE